MLIRGDDFMLDRIKKSMHASFSENILVTVDRLNKKIEIFNESTQIDSLTAAWYSDENLTFTTLSRKAKDIFNIRKNEFRNLQEKINGLNKELNVQDSGIEIEGEDYTEGLDNLPNSKWESNLYQAFEDTFKLIIQRKLNAFRADLQNTKLVSLEELNDLKKEIRDMYEKYRNPFQLLSINSKEEIDDWDKTIDAFYEKDSADHIKHTLDLHKSNAQQIQFEDCQQYMDLLHEHKAIQKAVDDGDLNALLDICKNDINGKRKIDIKHLSKELNQLITNYAIKYIYKALHGGEFIIGNKETLSGLLESLEEKDYSSTFTSQETVKEMLRDINHCEILLSVNHKFIGYKILSNSSQDQDAAIFKMALLENVKSNDPNFSILDKTINHIIGTEPFSQYFVFTPSIENSISEKQAALLKQEEQEERENQEQLKKQAEAEKTKANLLEVSTKAALAIELEKQIKASNTLEKSEKAPEKKSIASEHDIDAAIAATEKFLSDYQNPKSSVTTEVEGDSDSFISHRMETTQALENGRKQWVSDKHVKDREYNITLGFINQSKNQVPDLKDIPSLKRDTTDTSDLLPETDNLTLTEKEKTPEIKNTSTHSAASNNNPSMLKKVLNIVGYILAAPITLAITALFCVISPLILLGSAFVSPGKKTSSSKKIATSVKPAVVSISKVSRTGIPLAESLDIKHTPEITPRRKMPVEAPKTLIPQKPWRKDTSNSSTFFHEPSTIARRAAHPGTQAAKLTKSNYRDAKGMYGDDFLIEYRNTLGLSTKV
jgi:hypothetical protein